VYDELLVGGSDGKPRLYKMHRTQQRVIGDDFNRIREYAALPGRLFALRFNKDGLLFAAGSSLDGKGEVRVFKTDDAKELSKIDGIGGVYSVAFSPDGKTLASAGFDGNVVLSDPNTGKVIKKFVAVPLAAKDSKK
jgi:WD40 repeat protein